MIFNINSTRGHTGSLLVSATQANHQHISIAMVAIFKIHVATACGLNHTFRCNDEKRVLKYGATQSH